MFDYNQLARESHGLSREKGWYETERSDGEFFQLMIGEISEASEEVRAKNALVWQLSMDGSEKILPTDKRWDYSRKPEGELVELADCMIRIADYCGFKNIDISHHVSRCRQLSEGSSWVSILRGSTPLEQHLSVIQTLAFAGMRPAEAMAMALLKIQIIGDKRGGMALADVVKLKHDFNKTRPHRHGGKAL